MPSRQARKRRHHPRALCTPLVGGRRRFAAAQTDLSRLAPVVVRLGLAPSRVALYHLSERHARIAQKRRRQPPRLLREDGSVMAFEVLNNNGQVSAAPLWTSTNMVMPDPPVVANGVVYALSTGGQAMQNGAKPGDPRMTYDVSSVLRSRSSRDGG